MLPAAPRSMTDSWGRFPHVGDQARVPLAFASDALPTVDVGVTILPRGQGRSYGDSCMNGGGVLFATDALDRFIAFDRTAGVLRCEAGVTLEHILHLIVPAGWFLPVSPGTKFVSVGGALANDIHGKNHHVRGTFGCHVRAFELVRSTGERLVCTKDENVELYQATIGGLGLTGLITWVEMNLIPIENPFIENETILQGNLDEFFATTKDSVEHEYTVSWVDSIAKGKDIGRGLFFRGDHASASVSRRDPGPPSQKLVVPFDFPSFVLNRFSMKAFNVLFRAKEIPKPKKAIVHYNPFFYPLDAIGWWNRVYGERGFIQHQCVVPYDGDASAPRAILDRISKSDTASFLTVVKIFGDVKSPGMLSFPRPGVTLTFDFPMDGTSTLKLCDDLDAIVKEAGGALYPAKDARMSPEMFRFSFPRFEEFAAHVDPRFSSSFWRRVTSAS
jgi:FAD/FMN-containing dehydrogenase